MFSHLALLQKSLKLRKRLEKALRNGKYSRNASTTLRAIHPIRL
jgi:hypothetical protein